MSTYFLYLFFVIFRLYRLYIIGGYFNFEIHSYDSPRDVLKTSRRHP